MREGVRLAVDVGSVRIGLAVSDPTGRTAVPVGALARDAGDQEAVLAEAVERGCIEIVVGLPVGLSGREGPAAEAARAFATALAGSSRIPVRLVDERLSTVTATQRLAAGGTRGRRGRTRTSGRFDASAAAVFLQAALDAEVATGRPPGEKVTP
jgi:putative Holliday junction resolvase